MPASGMGSRSGPNTGAGSTSAGSFRNGRSCRRQPLVPFTQPNRFAFSASSIKAHAPNASGLYGIFNTTRWIYIGESNDIQQDLLQYLHQTMPPHRVYVRASAWAVSDRSPKSSDSRTGNSLQRQGRAESLAGLNAAGATAAGDDPGSAAA